MIQDLSPNLPVLTMDGPFNVEIHEGLAAVRSTTIVNPLSSDDVLAGARRTQAIGIVIINGILKSTGDHIHIIKRDGMWQARKADLVQEGDYLYHITNGETLVTSVVYDTENTYYVYKLNVAPNDVFFAHGYLTHNKKGLCDGGEAEICDHGSICYDPCHPDAWRWGCDFECEQQGPGKGGFE